MNRNRLAFVLCLLFGFGLMVGLAPSAQADEGSGYATCMYERWWAAENCGDVQWTVTIHQECLEAQSNNPAFVQTDPVCKADLAVVTPKVTKAKVKPAAKTKVTPPKVSSTPRVKPPTVARNVKAAAHPKAVKQASHKARLVKPQSHLVYVNFKISIGQYLQ